MPQPQPQPPQRARLAIWSPGTFRSLSGDQFSFSADDCQAIAASYSPTLFAAPMVKGHPKTDDPAHGWATGLEWDGEFVWADVDRLDPAFAEEWRAGRWGKVSPRFYLPNEPGNPMPGNYYLRHIGMLGAAAPANKDLPPADFAEGEGTVTFVDGLPELPAAEFGEAQWAFSALGDALRRLREWLIADRGMETADQIVPAFLIDTVHSAAESDGSPVRAFSAPSTQEPAMSDQQTPEQQAAFAAREAELNAEAQALKDRDAAITAREDASRRATCAAFAEQLRDDNRITPADAPFLTALLFEIGDAQCSFAEGDSEVTVATGERLREFLTRVLPKAAVPYGEQGAGDDLDASAVPAFAAPSGCQVDPARAELDRRARAYQQQHDCDYATAAIAVGA